MLDPRAKAVLEYWFGDLDHTPAYFEERNRLWFGAGPEVDEQIRRTFEKDLIAAVEGGLDAWRETPRGSMALIILLDQFSLQLYREQPRSYRQSELALPIAREVIARGWEFALLPAERAFLYLPFEHSEKIEDQDYCVARYSELASGASPDLRDEFLGALEWAVRHQRVVKKYGRFPDRNEVFGRKSTPEEEAFLASDEAPF
jgi:uncharacterized protein (DUF924 family)